MWRKFWIAGAFVLLILALAGCDSGAFTKTEQGNELYSQGRFDEALEDYQGAQIEQPDLPQLDYNIGNTLHQKEHFSEAITQTLKVLDTSDSDLQSQAHYNVGNSYFRQEQYEPAVEEYKAVLRLNPDDQDAKLNLELAQQRLQKQQDQQQQDQQQQDQQQQDQQQQDQQQQDQNDQGTPSPSPEREGQNQGDEGTPTPTPESEGQNQSGEGTPTPTPESEGQNQSGNGTPTPTPGATEQVPVGQSGGNVEGMTPEQARQLLEALGKEDQTLQEYLLKLQPQTTTPPGQDW